MERGKRGGRWGGRWPCGELAASGVELGEPAVIAATVAPRPSLAAGDLKRSRAGAT